MLASNYIMISLGHLLFLTVYSQSCHCVCHSVGTDKTLLKKGFLSWMLYQLHNFCAQTKNLISETDHLKYQTFCSVNKPFSYILTAILLSFFQNISQREFGQSNRGKNFCAAPHRKSQRKRVSKTGMEGETERV